MNNTIAQTEAYVPGVCNINRAEIAYRRKAGYTGAATFVVLAVLLVAIDVNRWIRLVLFIPAFVGIIGFLQARNRFCVSYAAKGRQNATDGSTDASSIEDKAAVRKDKIHARVMNMQATIAALAVTGLVVIL